MKSCPEIPVKVLIAYEDFATGQRAMKLCERLINNLGHDFQFRTCFWKFDILCLPKLKPIASQDAFHADVVIISTYWRDDLPAQVKSWMTSWPGKAPRHPQALVGLLCGDSDQSQNDSPARAFLEGFARNGRLAFFTQASAVPVAQAESFSDSGPTDRPTCSALEQILRARKDPVWQ